MNFVNCLRWLTTRHRCVSVAIVNASIFIVIRPTFRIWYEISDQVSIKSINNKTVALVSYEMNGINQKPENSNVDNKTYRQRTYQSEVLRDTYWPNQAIFDLDLHKMRLLTIKITSSQMNDNIILWYFSE